MNTLRYLSRGLLCTLFGLGLASPGFALELAPRQWSHLPTGVNFAGVAYAYTEADITVDPVLRLENVQMELDTWAAKYIRTFEVFDKSARIDITQAYQEGVWSGLLNGTPAAISRNGLSDTFVRFAINLYGAPPLSGKKYGAYRTRSNPETIVGMGLAVRLPTGDYMDDKLINLGQNRFVFRPQLGVQHTQGKWSAELTGEVALFAENDEFFNGNTLEQKPLYILRGHVIHTFRPGHWLGIGFGYDKGGESIINGVDKDDRRQNVALGINYSYPINRRSGINFAYIRTRTQESVGVNTDTLSLGFSFLW